MVSRLLADLDYVEEASADLSRRIEELLELTRSGGRYWG
jgi:hypothetical protein